MGDAMSPSRHRAQFTWYEFFAGGGMARLGLGDDWHCAFANEWSPEKAAAYRAHFGACPELKVEDVAKLSTADLPGQADLAWASFPCQDLSLAGSGAGLNGHRSGTFWPFWRLMEGLRSEDRKPKAIVLENVVGAITSHRGEDFAAILAGLAEAGYRFGPLVMDAARFVPQSRPRLFIVAIDAAAGIPGALARQAPDPSWHPRSLQTAHTVLPVELASKWIWWNIPLPPSMVPTFSSLIEPEPSGIAWHTPAYTRGLLSLMTEMHMSKVREVQEEEKLRVGTVYRRTRPVKVDGKPAGKTQRAEVRFDEISGCLRTPAGGSSRQTVLVVEGKRVRSRLLSPREAARLMGIPDEYPLPRRYNEAYHLCGDGVVVPVVAWLERHLLRPVLERLNSVQERRRPEDDEEVPADHAGKPEIDEADQALTLKGDSRQRQPEGEYLRDEETGDRTKLQELRHEDAALRRAVAQTDQCRQDI